MISTIVCCNTYGNNLVKVKWCHYRPGVAQTGSPDTTLAEPHPNSNTQQTKNVTANVVVQQHSRKLPKMGILMSKTCWVSKKNINVASDI